MATIDNLFGSTRGKLGNLVFYKVDGKVRVRTRAENFKDPKSPAQLAQRQRMQVTMGFLRQFSKLIRITFAAEAVGRTAMQAAQSYNMRHALAGEYPDVYVDKSKALLSRGPLPVPVSASVTAQPGELLIEWENDVEAAFGHQFDTLVVMAGTGEPGDAEFRFTDTRRSDGWYLWKTSLSGGTVAVWIAFRNREQTEMSDSLFAGELG